MLEHQYLKVGEGRGDRVYKEEMARDGRTASRMKSLDAEKIEVGIKCHREI